LKWIARLLAVAIAPCAAIAGEAHVAVAANFAASAKRLAEEFASGTGHKLTLSSGSTGKFYAQIKSGAPFDVLLSADAETPRRLEAEKLAVAGSRFTYALGRLVLWSPRKGFVDSEGTILHTAGFGRLAIANPRLAPYGAAAQQTMEKLGLWHALQGRIVQGENIAQTYQFVWSGNAELGFIAYSQLRERGETSGSYWLVPERLHAPLHQDAVLLVRGAKNTAARAFLEFLGDVPARESIRAHGYELPPAR
jgi:molybdate transport system substrate-binding protein